MRRRDFLGVVGGAAAWPLAARAQQTPKLVRIGFLSLSSGPTPSSEGLVHGLRQLGYIEGQNLVILYRWASGRRDRLVDLATELIQLNVDVFASQSIEAILAIQSVTKSVPIVMTAISDPIGSRLVASFPRPGGNTTGMTLYTTELAGKRLELLKEIAPSLSRVGVLAERDHPPTTAFIEETRVAANSLHIEPQIFEVRPEQIAEAFQWIGKEGSQGLVVQQSASFNPYIRQIADLAISHRLPTRSAFP
jgi:putative ABC transport system substrate-binding protein